MSLRTQDDRLKRISGSELEFPNRWGIPTRIFANEEIPLERVAVDELESVLQIQETADLLRDKAPDFLGTGEDAAVAEVVLTPDFHIRRRDTDRDGSGHAWIRRAASHRQ